MSQAQRLAIVKEDASHVRWQKMPFLNGWTYRATGHAQQDPDAPIDAEAVVEIAAGDRFQQIGVTRTLDATIQVSLTSVETKTPKRYTARVTSAEEARQLQKRSPQMARDDPKFWYKYTWLVVEDSGNVVLLQQEKNDEVIQSLDLNERGRWDRPKMSDDLFKSTCAAFAPWVPIAGAKPGSNWWEVPLPWAQMATAMADSPRGIVPTDQRYSSFRRTCVSVPTHLNFEWPL